MRCSMIFGTRAQVLIYLQKRKIPVFLKLQRGKKNQILFNQTSLQLSEYFLRIYFLKAFHSTFSHQFFIH